MALALFLALVFLHNCGSSFSYTITSISAPFVSHAIAPPSPTPSPSPSSSSGNLIVGSTISLLNSSDVKFSWCWVALPNGKFLLSVTYVPVSSITTTTIDATAGSTGAQQVWVANRNRPVRENATLQLQYDGNLVLRDIDGAIAWSTNTSTGSSIRLQDSGNLQLLNSRGSIAWQSFDHPSDTLLPGQVISTGIQVIASVSYSNTSEGKYSVVMEPGGLIMYVVTPSGSLPYHVVGFSTAERNNTVDSVQHPFCIGTSMNYSTGGGILTFRQTSTSEQPECNRSFVIQVGSNDNHSDVFFRLDSDGNFRTYVYRLHYGWGIDQEIFSGTLYCALPGKCGDFGVCSSYGSCSCLQISSSNASTELFHAKNPSDPTSGCVLSQPPSCDQSNHFVELLGASYFANDFTYQRTSSMDACKSDCAVSCDCSVAFYEQNTRRCYHYQNIMSIQNISDSSFRAFVKVGNRTSSTFRSSSDTHDTGSSLSSKMLLSIIICSALVTALCLVSFVALGMKIRRRLADMHADDVFLESLPGLPTRFSFKELHKATGGFSKRLGAGGFGTVYEGNLGDGTRVAVKRLESARQGQKEFHAEVATLGSINHLNLVRLRGFCTQRAQCLLVYDYMANGSLDNWLFSESKLLDWPTRYNIALDTARGLAFLHEESRERIVHLDVKPQNILLDERFIAKLSDFGLSKLIDRGENDVVTNMRGTPGYVAPEWLLQAAVTSKSDVYSFGMVLLELLSGRKNLDLSRNTFWYFPAWAVMKVEEGKMMELMDNRLFVLTEEMEKEVVRTIKVAMWCIQEDPNLRPCMTTVVRILEGHTEVEDPPSLLQFAMRTCSAAKGSSSSGPQTSSQRTSSQRTDVTMSTQLSNSLLSGPR